MLGELGRAVETHSYMWLYRSERTDHRLCCLITNKPAPANIRRNSYPGFSGYLQVDGYAGYGRVPNVTLIGCWAHVRRGFVETLAILAKESRSGATCAPAIGLEYCNACSRSNVN